MASLEDLKRNGSPIAVSVGGQESDPDNPTKTNTINPKTVIEHNKTKAPTANVVNTNVADTVVEDVEEEEVVLDDIEDTEDLDSIDESSAEDQIPVLPDAGNVNPEYVKGLEDIGKTWEEGDEKDFGTEDEIDENDYMEETYDLNEDINKDIEVDGNEYDPDAEEIESELDDDDDLSVDSEEVDIDDIDDEVMNHLREQITEKIKPASNVVDISSFTIAKKPIMNISGAVQNNEIGLAKWVCYSMKSSVLVRSFLGYELEQLRQNTNNARQGQQALNNTGLSDETINQINSEVYRFMMDRYKIVYDHIESPKPPALESWLMGLTASDMDDIFFDIYISSFKDSNFIPVDCQNPKCNNTVLHSDFTINDMVKFPTPEVEARFREIYNSDPVANTEGILATEVVPVSDSIAIGFKQASIYDEVVKFLLSIAFRRKYDMIVGISNYIDSIYVINQESQQLIPIGYKKYTNNKIKTFKSKLIKWNNALSVLTSDQFNIIYSYIQELQRLEVENRPSYIIPEYTCDKCGYVSPESEATGEMLVFTRSQLAAMSNTSIS